MAWATYIAGITTLGILLRWAVSLNPYSGANKPPMFGDYEAQRHWMEITYNLPIKEWYVNSSQNDLQYWGLDYPPLTAYHSWLAGSVANKINSSWIELFTSRGIESAEHKLFMRYSVIVVDLLVYFPATFLYAANQNLMSEVDKVGAIVALITYPGIVLIDYGHFQYNCISLGLLLLAMAFISSDRDLLASVAFVLALNYKQMELYHALPFFCYLLGSCFNGKQNWFFKLVKLGVVVVATFAACWWPFLQDKDVALQVLSRLFPFSRGLYEDKVSNFWCSISVIVKVKNIFTVDQIIKICLGTTLFMLLPSSLSLLLRPTKNKFKIALINSSLIFFLFSFQVHEKSILLAALPACAFIPHRPFACLWFLLISTFSMLPLLIKDGLVIPTFASCILFYMIMSITFEAPPQESRIGFTNRTFVVKSSSQYMPTDIISNCLFALSMLGCLGLTAASLVVTPPPRFPDLFPVLVSVYSCGHFILFMIYFHWLQVTWVDVPVAPPRAPQKQAYPRYSKKKQS